MTNTPIVNGVCQKKRQNLNNFYELNSCVRDSANIFLWLNSNILNLGLYYIYWISDSQAKDEQEVCINEAKLI